MKTHRKHGGAASGIGLALAFGLASTLPTFATGQQTPGRYAGWSMYGGTSDSLQYSSLKQINRQNAKQLQQVWSYDMGESVTTATPVVLDGVMYIPGQGEALVALDAATGRQIWRREGVRTRTRGLTIWKSADGNERRLIYFQDQTMRALNAQTGEPILTFGVDGAVDLRQGLGRDPASIGSIQPNTPGKIYGNILILGSNPGENYGGPPGDIRAFDVITGRQLWTFHTIPHPGEEGYETWENAEAWKTAAAANNWGGMSIDEARGIVYVPLGSASYDFWGGDRPGANLYSDSLVALDARTGKKLWHFQTVHHDLWDYDLTSSPALMTIRRDGKPLDIVVQAAKSGFIFAFDRVTGKPLWPIEERPVPQSNMPGNPAWPTQPFPTVIEPFARQTFTEEDIDPKLVAEERAAITSQLRAARNEGLFTPPGTTDTVQMPGNHGGVNWGLTAGDPVRGRFYVASYDLPSILKLEQSETISNQLFTGPLDRGAALYRANCRICHGAELQGGAGIPALADATTRLGAAETKRVISEGQNTMPAFGGTLSSADIDAVVAYLADPGAARPPRPGQDHAASGAASPTSSGPLRYSSPFGFLLAKSGDPVIKPPWMTLSAYDMNTGRRLWQAPVGSALGHEGVQTGVSRNKGGVVVTAGGLVLATTAEDRMLHIWNSDTGKLITQYELPSAPQGVPAVYSAGGRQFIVVPAAYYARTSVLFPRGFGPKPARNAYVALALPVKEPRAAR